MLAERSTYEEWLKLGRPDMYAKARKKVQAILGVAVEQPLPGDVVGKLEDIMRRADGEPRRHRVLLTLFFMILTGTRFGTA